MKRSASVLAQAGGLVVEKQAACRGGTKETRWEGRGRLARELDCTPDRGEVCIPNLEYIRCSRETSLVDSMTV